MSDEELRELMAESRQSDAASEATSAGFSYADFARRMRTLEETVASLQTRVERLESAAH